MATAHTNGTEGDDRSVLNNLFAPVDVKKILIPGESIVYNERRHWASLIQPMLETLGALILITSMSGTTRATGPVGAFIIVAVVGLVVYRIRSGDVNKMAAYGTIGALVLSFLITGNWFVTAVLAILAICARFLYKIIFWLSYERLFITNRRIVLAEAFLGSDISTMPLTRVTDISYRTTVPADILGYGILRVETAGQDQALSEIRFLEKPNEFYNKLIERTTAAVGSVTAENDEDDGSGTLEP